MHLFTDMCYDIPLEKDLSIYTKVASQLASQRCVGGAEKQMEREEEGERERD